MRAMQAELAANPAAGCLAVRHTEAFANPTRLVQIWRRRAPRRRGAAGARRARPPSLGSPPRARAARAAAGRACCARRARKRRRPPRSYDHLAAFARDGMAQHLGTWMAWDAKARAFKSREVPGVGIYHWQSYLVSAGSYEAIYRNMPPMGLAKVGRIVSVSAAGPGVCVRVRARVCGGARVRARGCVRVCAVLARRVASLPLSRLAAPRPACTPAACWTRRARRRPRGACARRGRLGQTDGADHAAIGPAYS